MKTHMGKQGAELITLVVLVAFQCTSVNGEHYAPLTGIADSYETVDNEWRQTAWINSLLHLPGVSWAPPMHGSWLQPASSIFHPSPSNQSLLSLRERQALPSGQERGESPTVCQVSHCSRQIRLIIMKSYLPSGLLQTSEFIAEDHRWVCT